MNRSMDGVCECALLLLLLIFDSMYGVERAAMPIARREQENIAIGRGQREYGRRRERESEKKER